MIDPSAAQSATEPAKDSRSQSSRRWQVVLLDDDQHTFDYVIEMLARLFGHPESVAYRFAEEIDRESRAVVWTGYREAAEFKQDQILQYGADPRIATSTGSMTAVLEAAV
ncbi:MAG TPA: ATP-dependent Clp protease adaptor ClpS [Planctomycetota bacterium]